MTWTDIAWKLLYALLILFAGNLAASWLGGAANLALDRARLDPAVRQLVVRLIRPAVLALALFAALAQLGIPMTAFAAVAGAVVLALGLALHGGLSNLVSGAMLLSLRPYGVDDTVTVAGHAGTVRGLHLLATVLDTPEGDVLTVPNNLVWKHPIVAQGALPTSRIQLAYTLPPEADPALAEAELLAALTADARALGQPAPATLWGAVGPAGVQLTGQVWVNTPDRAAAQSDLQREVLARFRSAGIPWGPHAPAAAPRRRA